MEEEVPEGGASDTTHQKIRHLVTLTDRELLRMASKNRYHPIPVFTLVPLLQV